MPSMDFVETDFLPDYRFLEVSGGQIAWWEAGAGGRPIVWVGCLKMPAHKMPRLIYESARDVARGIARMGPYVTSRRERERIEMLFAHLKRILRFDRFRLRGPCDARDQFPAQNLRKLAKLLPASTPMPI